MPPAIVAVASAVATAATEVAAAAIPTLTIAESGLVYSVVYATVDTAITLGASIGLSLLLAPKPPGLPAVQSPLKQSVPPRRSGYGRARLSGYYMLYTAVGPASYDVLALHDGLIDGFERYFLNDDEVLLNPTYDGVISPDGRKYAVFDNSSGGSGDYRVFIHTRLGEMPSTSFSGEAGWSRLGTTWTDKHRGDGIASLALSCEQSKQKDQQTNYPNGLPQPSASARLLRLFDPRIDGFDRIGTAWSSTWSWSANPALALIDFLADPDHGMGLDYATRIKPAIDLWRAGADICDQPIAVRNVTSFLTAAATGGFHTILVNGVTGLSPGMTVDVGFDTPASETLTVQSIGPRRANGTLITFTSNLTRSHDNGDEVTWAAGADGTGFENRYSCGGVFEHTTAPADVITQILSTCDGWLGQRGDGSLVFYAGQYYEPTVILGDDAVIGYSVRHFLPDEETINQLLPTYTEPAQKFGEVDAGQWDNVADQVARGRVRSQAMPLPWVPSMPQARRLAKRAMSRYAAEVRGQIKTNMYGMLALGERFVRLRISENAALHDIVVEISKVQIDLASLSLTFDWVAADPAADEWSTAEEIASVPQAIIDQAVADTPAISAVDIFYDTTAGDTPGARLAVTAGVADDSMQWLLRWRVEGAPAWTDIAYTAPPLSGDSVTLDTGFVPSSATIEVQVAAQTAGSTSPWSASSFVTVPAIGVAAGFGFADEGLYLDNEFLGTASWPTDVTFSASNPGSYLNADSAATGDAVFRILSDTLAELGTFTVAAGSKAGVIAFAVDPYVHPAQTPMHFYAPVAHDATLANVVGRVTGDGV